MPAPVRSVVLAAVATVAVAAPVGAWASTTSDRTAPSDSAPSVCAVGDAFARTELFFGLSRPGGTISNRQFERFVDDEITKRFPDGLTVIKADGQFKNASGAIIEERSRVLILFHGGDAESSAAIDAIREEYRDQFDQESVLRADAPSCVSF